MEMSLIIHGDGQWRWTTWSVITVLRIRGDGSFDPWGELLAGGDELILEMRPDSWKWGFWSEDLRALKTYKDETFNFWGSGTIVFIDPWEVGLLTHEGGTISL